jgi:MSHA biogenesis protein MshQ
LSVEGAADLRSGRARLINAYGSELLDLPVPFRTEYWASATGGWQLNSADTCTDATLAFAPVGTTDITGRTCVIEAANRSGKGCAAAPAVAGRAYLETGVAGFAGNFNLWLRAPGTGFAGAVDLTATVPAWLQFKWTGVVGNPTARARFGVYRTGPVIYRREMY